MFVGLIDFRVLVFLMNAVDLGQPINQSVIQSNLSIALKYLITRSR